MKRFVKLSRLVKLNSLCRLGLSASILFSSVLHSLVAVASSGEFVIAEPEAWIIERQSPAVPDNARSLAERGVYYLLLDRQVNALTADARSSYYATEYKLTNRTGVRNKSTIEIEYDPAYESVVLHDLGITRDGRYISRLESSDIQQVRTESELDDLFYNGTVSLTAILQDVRVGDVVRYSYTRNGYNPVYDDLFEYGARTQFYVPVDQASFRALVSADEDVVIRDRDNDILNITETVANGVRYINWAGSNLKPLKWYDDEPHWRRNVPGFSVSSVADWGEVVRWALPKYKKDEAIEPEIERVAKKINRRHKRTKDRIGAALQWVQDEIRYFGVELGDNSHNPSPPSETLARRFGDCKDKSVLLIALLKEMGIYAQPALVHSSNALRNEDAIYRLHAFDHVIVHVDQGGESHWIDPTRSDQQGALGEFYEPAYGKALIVAEGNTELVDMTAKRSMFELDVYERLVIDEEDDNIASMVVRSRREGLSAERYRRYVDDYGLTYVSEGYVDYYRNKFGYVEANEKLRYHEFPRNSSYAYESYTIEDLWIENDDGSFSYEMEADEAIGYLAAPKAARYRERDYALDYPVKITEVNIVKLAHQLEEDSAREVIKNDYFTFSARVEQSKDTNEVSIRHSYESHAPVVPVADILSYSRDIKRAREISSVYIGKDGLGWGNDEPDESETDADISVVASREPATEKPE